MKPARSSGDDRVSRPRALLLAGGALTAAGIAIAATVAPAAGTATIALGWIVFAYSLHSFGRGDSRS